MGLFWLVIIVLAVLIDLLTSAFIFSGFSIGAMVAIVLSIFNVPFYIQVLVFSIIGVLFILFLSPRIKKAIKRNSNNVVKNTAEKLVGKELISEKDIEKEELMIFEGSYWTFKNIGEKIKKGDSIKVLSVEGNKIIVKK
ncbi:MAG: NfeD family protein [Sarcina sp.]